MPLVKRTTILLNQTAWVDTGVDVSVGDFLEFEASGVGGVGTYPGPHYWVVYPEGTYWAFNEQALMPDEQYTQRIATPAHTKDYAGIGTANVYVVGDTMPMSLNMVILPPGEVPGFGIAAVEGAVRVGRELKIESVETAGRVWMIFNDVADNYVDNYGQFEVKIRYPGVIDPGQVSPLRFCPDHIKAQKVGPEGTLTWIIALQRKDGVWMGMSAWDVPFQGLQSVDKAGNVVPALLYEPVGASITNQKVELKLGSSSTDAKFLAPRYDSYVQMGAPDTLYIDRESLESGELDDAFWVLGEIDPTYPAGGVMWWNCGHVGNVEYGDLEGTAELQTYDEIANRDTSNKLHIFCQVGAWKGEDYGLLRCRGLVVEDGIKREEWSVMALVEEGSTLTTLRLVYDKSESLGGVPLSILFPLRFANGDAEFHLTSAGGGRNAGHKIRLSGGRVLSEDGDLVHVEVTTKLSMRFLVAEGDALVLVAGCVRTKEACNQVANIINGRFQELPSNEDLARRSKMVTATT